MFLQRSQSAPDQSRMGHDTVLSEKQHLNETYSNLSKIKPSFHKSVKIVDQRSDKRTSNLSKRNSFINIASTLTLLSTNVLSCDEIQSIYSSHSSFKNAATLEMIFEIIYLEVNRYLYLLSVAYSKYYDARFYVGKVPHGGQHSR